MRESILNKLVCPACHLDGLSLLKRISDLREILVGELACPACQKEYKVKAGIIDFLAHPSASVVAEIAGWKQYHTPQRNPEQFRDQWLLKLPRLDANVSSDLKSIESWNHHADNFDLAMDQIGLEGKEEILELGAGRCWASAAFARLGCTVIALDVVRDKYIGLESGGVYLSSGLFFERVLADMERLPFADRSFDLVFSTATVHHAPDLDKLCAEASRVLRPGGRFVAINDTVAGWLDSAQDLEEIELGINEHAHPITRYRQAMKRAGLSPKFFMPATWRKELESGQRDMRHPLKIAAFTLCSAFWRNKTLRNPLEYCLANWAQLAWGIGLHAIAIKR